jgi:hypothetical protein
MPDRNLPSLLAAYRAGVERELDALERLETLAHAQLDAATRGDVDRVLELTKDRAVIWGEIDAEEAVLGAARVRLHERLGAARRVDGFDEVADRHRLACTRLDAIAEVDHRTLTQLEFDARTKRDLAKDLEAGEATLAAYRRVTSDAAASAELVDRRG